MLKHKKIISYYQYKIYDLKTILNVLFCLINIPGLVVMGRDSHILVVKIVVFV